MSNRIEGKVVVITGASSGLGEAPARFLFAQGATVVLGARRVDRLKSLADELNGTSGRKRDPLPAQAPGDVSLGKLPNPHSQAVTWSSLVIGLD